MKTGTSEMSSKIEDVDPFLMALFNIPGTFVDNGERIDSRTYPSKLLDISVESDNVSFLHGENISMNDEKYSDTELRFPVDKGFSPFLPRPRINGTNAVADVTTRMKGTKSTAMKSLKKLVGRNSSSRSLSPSFDDTDSVNSNYQCYGTPVQTIDGSMSLDRLSALQSNIRNIRSTIHSLEGDLVATRNELAKAHQNLHFATMELNDIQRIALETDVALSKLANQNGGGLAASRMSPLFFFDASSTPRSRSTSTSSDSFVSVGEYEVIDSPIELSKDSSISKRNMRVKTSFKRIKSIESDSNNTPSTAASSEVSDERRVSFSAKEAFIRVHDLAINNGSGKLLSIRKTGVRDIVNALFEKGCEYMFDETDRWIPEQGTGKLISKRPNVDTIDGPMGNWPNAAYGDDVLVWSTKCSHTGFGSEYPMVKARGLIPACALQMVELLLDSGRVKEYNKMSLGRIDEHYFVKGVERSSECPVTGLPGEVKICCSKSQPPVIRKPVELRLLLHARPLPSNDGNDGSIFLTVGRSAWETEAGTIDTVDQSVTRCEMLLSVNLIRDLPPSVLNSKEEQWCEITTITHGVSPGIPISIGRRVGLAAAAKYIRDIRAVFAK